MKETPVEPTNAPRTDSKWATLIPAIAVPVVVVLFLIFAFVWTRYAAKRKREQKKVEPLKVIPFIICLKLLEAGGSVVVWLIYRVPSPKYARTQLKDGESLSFHLLTRAF